MRIRTNGMRSRSIAILMAGILWCFVGAIRTAAQQRVSKDPAEPLKGQPKPRILPRPAGAIARASIDEKMMKELIHEQVGCGTRLTISSWTDPKRGIGCGRDFVVPRLEAISKATGGKLQIVVDKFEMKSERTGAGPVHLENIYAVLSGDDPKLTKTIYIVVGDFDSRPSDVMDTAADAPGADDDASGTAVSVECARQLSKLAASGKVKFRGTILFGVLSGEEQGLLGCPPQ